MTIKLSLPCGSKEDCLELAEHILRARGVNASLLKYEIRGGSLTITVFGSSIEKTACRNAILRAFREWREIKGWRSGTPRGHSKIRLNYLMRLVGKPFITDALVETLRHLGYEASVEGDYLVSNVRWEVVVDLASKLGSKLEELVRLKPRASHSAKALITAASVLLDMKVGVLVEELRSRGVLREEGPRLTLRREWRNLLKELLKEGMGR